MLTDQLTQNVFVERTSRIRVCWDVSHDLDIAEDYTLRFCGRPHGVTVDQSITVSVNADSALCGADEGVFDVTLVCELPTGIYDATLIAPDGTTELSTISIRVVQA